MLCKKCGTISDGKSRFCASCGAGLIDANPPRPSTAAVIDDLERTLQKELDEAVASLEQEVAGTSQRQDPAPVEESYRPSILSSHVKESPLSPSSQEMKQAANFVFSSPVVQDNDLYKARLDQVRFTFLLKPDVNAYATDLRAEAGGTVPVIAFYQGLAIATRLAAEGILKHADQAATRRDLVASSPLGSLFHAIGHAGTLPIETAAQIYRDHISSEAPVPAHESAPMVQSYAAAMNMFVIAHEAGHLALGHTLAREQPMSVSRNQEREADSFAASVLGTSPFREYLFLGHVLTTVIFCWIETIEGEDSPATTHPHARERFENALRSHDDTLAEMSKRYGLTEQVLRGLLPEQGERGPETEVHLVDTSQRPDPAPVEQSRGPSILSSLEVDLVLPDANPPYTKVDWLRTPDGISPVVEVKHYAWFNYALFHSGVPLVMGIEITNDSGRDLTNPMVEIDVLPRDYGEPWQHSTGPIAHGDSWRHEGVQLPLRLDRLRRVEEMERASLKVTLSDQGQVMWTSTNPIGIHPYNNGVLIPGEMKFLAAFVTPNRPIVKEIRSRAATLLEERTGNASMSGYQSRSSARVREVVAALHDTLIDDYQLRYNNPPASFEDIGQRIRLPEEIIEYKGGTCLDLAVLLASLIESAGLHPFVVVIRGHAFIGFWTVKALLTGNPVPDLLHDPRLLEQIKNRNIIVFNSVNLCKGERFESAEAEGLGYVAKVYEQAMAGDHRHYIYMVDVVACRRQKESPVKPLP